MRRFRFCEERGSGIDKVVAQIELFQLPAPLFEAPEGFTRIVLFAHRPLKEMDKADRIRACYLHACLKWVLRGAHDQRILEGAVRDRGEEQGHSLAADSRGVGCGRDPFG